MKLGFMTAILPDLSLEEVLKFAAAEKFEVIEVMCWPKGKADRKYAGVTHIDCADFSQAAADDVRSLFDKYGVGLASLGYYPNVLSAVAEESELAIAHLRRVIDAAPKLGVRIVNTFVGNDHHRNLEHSFQRFAAVWPDLVKLAEDRDVYLGIENCPMLFTNDEWPAGKNLAHSPAIWRRMYEIIPSAHLGINFDPSHFVLQMMDYIQPIYDFRDRIFHVHAKDLRIDRKLLNDRGVLTFDWYTPKCPGLGDVDWPRLMSALTDVGYQGDICIEIEDEAFRQDLESRKNALRLSRNVLRPLVI